MAGWRRTSHGDGGEPVELVDDGDPSEVEIAAGRSIDWHGVLRTGAAVVGALSLLWMGRSWADERADADERECLNDIQQAYSRYEQHAYSRGWDGQSPPVEREVTEELAERARSCGGDAGELYADALLHEPSTDD